MLTSREGYIFKLEMTLHETAQRRRLFVVWIASVVLCATAVLAALLIQPPHGRFLGFDIAGGLRATAYAATAFMFVATYRWFQAAPKRATRITVRELRKRAGYGD